MGRHRWHGRLPDAHRTLHPFGSSKWILTQVKGGHKKVSCRCACVLGNALQLIFFYFIGTSLLRNVCRESSKRKYYLRLCSIHSQHSPNMLDTQQLDPPFVSVAMDSTNTDGVQKNLSVKSLSKALKIVGRRRQWSWKKRHLANHSNVLRQSWFVAGQI